MNLGGNIQSSDSFQDNQMLPRQEIKFSLKLSNKTTESVTSHIVRAQSALSEITKTTAVTGGLFKPQATALSGMPTPVSKPIASNLPGLPTGPQVTEPAGQVKMTSPLAMMGVPQTS